MDKILYINSCVREESRTNYLAKYLLFKLKGNITEIKLNDEIKPLDSVGIKKRDELLRKEDYNNHFFDLANQFKDADIVVISAPYWDLSFPSLLKIYFENVNSCGITFDYDAEGKAYTLCKIKKMYYVTTAGGYIIDDVYGYGYIKQLFETFFGVNDFKYIKAEGLDIFDSNVDEILTKAKKEIDKLGE